MDITIFVTGYVGLFSGAGLTLCGDPNAQQSHCGWVKLVSTTKAFGGRADIFFMGRVVPLSLTKYRMTDSS